MESELGFQVGLLEVGVDLPGVCGLEVRVAVDIAVRGIDRPVQAGTVAAVCAVRYDDQFVGCG